MLRQSRSETDDLHRTIAVKDTELIAERNVLFEFYKIFFDLFMSYLESFAN
jgi:hypothetical protein